MGEGGGSALALPRIDADFMKAAAGKEYSTAITVSVTTLRSLRYVRMNLETDSL